MSPLKGNAENYQNGETIFEDGEMGAEVFVLIEGRVELIKRGRNSSVEVAVLEPGATFGEMAALDSQPRSLTARALGDVTVEVVEQEALLDTLHRDPEFAREIMTGLAIGMRTLHDMLAGNLEFKTIAVPAEETESETIERTENEMFALLKRIFGRGRADEAVSGLADVIAPDDGAYTASAATTAGEEGGGALMDPVETHEMAVAAKDLFETWQAAQEPVVVLVANLNGDTGGSVANEISAAIDGQQGLMARRIENLLEHDDQGDIERQLAGAAQRGREWLAAENASVLVWGELTHEGSVISLRFIPLRGSGETTPGGYSLVTKLDLPLEFTIQAAELLCASVICALGPKSQAQRERLEITDLLEEAQDACSAALEVFTDTQYRWNWAVTQNCLGKILFKQGVATAETAKFKDAIIAFQSALKVFARKVAPERWAEVINNIGTVLQFFGVRTKREDVLTAAANIFRTAANARSREDAPILWATSHNNLGTSLFFLAKESPKMEVLDEAALTFQHALSIFKAFGSERMAGLAVGNMARLAEYKKALHGVETAEPSNDDESPVDGDDNEANKDECTAGSASDVEHVAATPEEADTEDQNISAVSN